MLADLDRLGPELVVLSTAGIILLADLVMPRERVRWLAGVALAGLAAATLWLVLLIVRDREASFFSDSMALDNFSIFFMFLFIGVSGAVIIASLDYVERFGKHQSEFFALTLIATAGMMLSSSLSLTAVARLSR